MPSGCQSGRFGFLRSVRGAFAVTAFGWAVAPLQAAPELLVNARGDERTLQGWEVVAGSVAPVGLVRLPDGSVLTPAEGIGVIRFDTSFGQVCVIRQRGAYSMDSQRVALSGIIRAPSGAGTMQLTIRALDEEGVEVRARTVSIAAGPEWVDALATSVIPFDADHWEVELLALGGGSFGIHADAFSMIGTCEQDLNGDRVVNFFDLGEFLALFSAGDLEVDFDRSGDLDFLDLSEFLSIFGDFCE